MLPHASLADIPPDVRVRIDRRLSTLAESDRVRIVLAVESGSRAWGFASPDSDFDVRFLYVRRAEDYAALFAPRDVLEFPVEDGLDFSGWDLRKALALGLAWNPALIEWLTSPIVYREAGWEAEALRALFARPMSRDALIRHYYGLGSKQFARHIGSRAHVNLKKYFYVVRPAVALLWLEQRSDETPPMSLPALVAGVELPADVVVALGDLRERKAGTSEFGEGERVAALDAFCEARLAWGLARLPKSPLRLDAGQKRTAEELFQASVFARERPAG